MTDESEFRQRDEAARDRDEMSRTRDELSRDREVFSQRATRAARSVQTWATIVVIIMVAGLFYVTEQRKDAIEEIQEAAIRIEEAATNAETVLIEMRAERQTPEAIAQSQRVREALRDIAVVRGLLCELPELADIAACNE